MLTLQDAIREEMKDPEFRAEWEALEPEFQIIRGIIEGRKATGLTQEQLSKATGIDQANISKLQNGTANPSLRTLKRLAAGMGMALKVEFVPIPHPSGQ